MKSIFCIFIFLTATPNKLLSQQKPIRYNPLEKPNTYRNFDNPNYWGNKKPKSDYWQQDVYYQIKANINEENDRIEGTETLTYWNNSPDNLSIVYFHLCQNTFQSENNYYDLNSLNKKITQDQNENKENKKKIIINEIKSEGRSILLEYDNTILKVHLNKPINSGDSIVFEIKFIKYFCQRSIDRKMNKYKSNGKKHYDGVHWYPKISVYEAESGWTKEQYLGNKFYGDFGTFDVELTFASNYITEATGFLLNREDVLPKNLRKKLDVKNFKDKPWNEIASEIIPYDSENRKTWKFHAENVHDFAFTSDPSFRIGEASWNGITCYTLVKECHASKWQNMAEYVAKIIKVFSQDLGLFTYNKMIVADSKDIMEYPMLTFYGGFDLSSRKLLVQEISSNWFYIQTFNNKSCKSSLDLGFIKFLTSWKLGKIDSELILKEKSTNKFIYKNTKSIHPKDINIFYPYINNVTRNNNPKISFNTDDFPANNNCFKKLGQIYLKTATMLYNLQYTLGDELFSKAINNYYETWKIARPYFEDFKKSIIDFTKVDLNWFFNQWIDSNIHIDYAIKSVKKLKNSTNSFEITFMRKGAMQMPIDFRVIDKIGNTEDYHIPNSSFIKKTDANLLNPWIGMQEMNPKHRVKIISEFGLKDIVIDPSNRLADIYMIDNSLNKNITFKLENFFGAIPDWKKYEAKVSPRFAYNGFDGIKTGIRLIGNYMNYHHQFDGTFWINTGFNQIEEHLPHSDIPSKSINGYDRISYQFKYETGLNKLNKGLSLYLSSRKLDGLNLQLLGFNQTTSTGADLVNIEFKAIKRPKDEQYVYLLNPEETFWQTNQRNNTINVSIQHHYKYFFVKGIIDLSFRSSLIKSDYQYSQLSLKALNNFNFKKFKLKTRIFAQHSIGTNIAPESKLYAAGANPEEMMENVLTRSTGLIARDWVNYSSKVNYFHVGGGLNLRAYNGYLMPEGNNLQQILSFNGTSGSSFSAELEFNDYLSFFDGQKMKTYGFIDMGWININNLSQKLNLGSFRMDGGFGFCYDIQGVYENTTQLRVDLPWFMNKPPADENYFTFSRFIIGLNRSF